MYTAPPREHDFRGFTTLDSYDIVSFCLILLSILEAILAGFGIDFWSFGVLWVVFGAKSREWKRRRRRGSEGEGKVKGVQRVPGEDLAAEGGRFARPLGGGDLSWPPAQEYISRSDVLGTYFLLMRRFASVDDYISVTF